MGKYDILLRDLAHKHPEALVRAIPVQGRVKVLGWRESQVTATEQRLDAALVLRVGRSLRALQVEFEHKLKKQMGRRVYRYQALFDLARGNKPPLPIETLVVVLTGPAKDLPGQGAHPTGWPECTWAGARFHVDAVYQRTVEELFARKSLWWLLFVPLARDATAAALRRVVEELCSSATDPEEREPLFWSLRVLAELDPWQHNLGEELDAIMEQYGATLMKVSKTARGIHAQGIEKGIEKGVKKGVKKGVTRMLKALLVQRIGREVTAQEKKALADHARAEEPEAVQRRLLALEGDALVAWLLGTSDDGHGQA